MTQLHIAPSILAADWLRLRSEIEMVVDAGCEWLHIDVMDGQFVPPITFGADMVKAIRRIPIVDQRSITLDVHLMVMQPEAQVQAFVDAGADFITVHQECSMNLHRTLQDIRKQGARPGVAINPATPVSVLSEVTEDCDLFLIMSVNPGWGGQKFIERSTHKLSQARELITNSGGKIHLEVDGGINSETAALSRKAGADVLVAGSYIFKSDSPTKAIESLRG